MEFVYDRDGNVDSWEAVMFLYKSALKKMTLNMQILNDEFEYVHQYNPIEHIKSRLKEPESIVKKLKRHGYDSTLENMVKYVPVAKLLHKLSFDRIGAGEYRGPCGRREVRDSDPYGGDGFLGQPGAQDPVQI